MNTEQYKKQPRSHLIPERRCCMCKSLKLKNLNAFCPSHLCRCFVECLLAQNSREGKQNEITCCSARISNTLFPKKGMVRTAWGWYSGGHAATKNTMLDFLEDVMLDFLEDVLLHRRLMYVRMKITV